MKFFLINLNLIYVFCSVDVIVRRVNIFFLIKKRDKLNEKLVEFLLKMTKWLNAMICLGVVVKLKVD